MWIEWRLLAQVRGMQQSNVVPDENYTYFMGTPVAGVPGSQKIAWGSRAHKLILEQRNAKSNQLSDER